MGVGARAKKRGEDCFSVESTPPHTPRVGAPPPQNGPMPPACRLLAGPSAAAAQIVLAALSLAALAARRARERPRRPARVFAFDVAKQATSAAAAHAAGLGIAVAAAAGGGEAGARGERGAASECGWYLVAFALDTVVGTAAALALHRALVRAATRAAARPAAPPWVRSVAACGCYGDPPSARALAPQLAEWVACVLAGRALCGALVWAGLPWLVRCAAGVDGALAGAGPTGELFAVMLAGPLALNLAQALVQDGVLRRGKAGGGSGGGEGTGLLAGAGVGASA